MSTSFKSTKMLILGGLSAGLLVALWNLGMRMPGWSPLLVVAVGAVVLSCGLSGRGRNSFPTLIGTALTMLIAMLLVSLSTSDEHLIVSSLCWTGVTFSVALGIVTVLHGTSEAITTNVAAPATVQSVSESLILQELESEANSKFASPHIPEFTRWNEVENGFETEENNSSDEEIVQSWSRVNSSNEDRLEGTLILDMEANQKQRYIHLPFLPFFDATPLGYCECLTDIECDAEFDQLHIYGGRLNVRRRSQISRPCRIEISFVFVAERTIAQRAA